MAEQNEGAIVPELTAEEAAEENMTESQKKRKKDEEERRRKLAGPSLYVATGTIHPPKMGAAQKAEIENMRQSAMFPAGSEPKSQIQKKLPATQEPKSVAQKKKTSAEASTEGEALSTKVTSPGVTSENKKRTAASTYLPNVQNQNTIRQQKTKTTGGTSVYVPGQPQAPARAAVSTGPASVAVPAKPAPAAPQKPRSGPASVNFPTTSPTAQQQQQRRTTGQNSVAYPTGAASAGQQQQGQAGQQSAYCQTNQAAPRQNQTGMRQSQAAPRQAAPRQNQSVAGQSQGAYNNNPASAPMAQQNPQMGGAMGAPIGGGPMGGPIGGGGPMPMSAPMSGGMMYDPMQPMSAPMMPGMMGANMVQPMVAPVIMTPGLVSTGCNGLFCMNPMCPFHSFL